MKAEPITSAVDMLAGSVSQMEPIVRMRVYGSGGGVAGSCIPTAVTTGRTQSSRSRVFGPSVVRCSIASIVLENSHVGTLSPDVSMKRCRRAFCRLERQLTSDAPSAVRIVLSRVEV